MNTDSLKTLQVFFDGDDAPAFTFDVAQSDDDPDFYTLGNDREIVLPNDEKLLVYAEVGMGRDIPDVSISILEGDRCLAIRCGEGVIVSYQTLSNVDVQFQIGSGAWEE